MPERLELPNEFPAARDVRELGDIKRQQQNWWYDTRRALQRAIEGLRGQADQTPDRIAILDSTTKKTKYLRVQNGVLAVTDT